MMAAGLQRLRWFCTNINVPSNMKKGERLYEAA